MRCSTDEIRLTVPPALRLPDWSADDAGVGLIRQEGDQSWLAGDGRCLAHRTSTTPLSGADRARARPARAGPTTSCRPHLPTGFACGTSPDAPTNPAPPFPPSTPIDKLPPATEVLQPA